MTSAYLAPLVTKPVVIDEPGVYVTRAGELVDILKASARYDFNCRGQYRQTPTVTDRWHKSGRLYPTILCANDIVQKVS
jgi:hypothetical protein